MYRVKKLAVIFFTIILLLLNESGIALAESAPELIWVNVKDFDTIGDGSSHPLSQRFATIEAARQYYTYTFPEYNWDDDNDNPYPITNPNPNATPPVNLMAFDLTDEIDWVAIQSAVESVRNTSATAKKIIYLPPGHYVIKKPIRLDIDNLEFRGTKDTYIELYGHWFAIWNAKGVNLYYGNTFQDTSRVTVKDININATHGFGPNDAGILVLSFVQDFLIENVKVLGDKELLAQAVTQRDGTGRRSDGISVNGSEGVIRNCVVEGTTKPGIYVPNSSNYVRVENCITRNIGSFNDAITGAPGVQVSGNQNTLIINHQAYGCEGAGVLITTDGYPPGVGSSTKHVQVLGGQFYENTNGILFASVNVNLNQMPNNVIIKNVDVSYNNGDGIQIPVGRNIIISDIIAKANKLTGIKISNNYGLTEHIEIRNSYIYNNSTVVGDSKPGIAIFGVNRVTIKGGSIFDDQTGGAKTQDRAITTASATNPYTGQIYNVNNLRIIDVDAYGNSIKNFSQSEVVSGFYKIQDNGNPNGSINAPVGSVYTDLQTGVKYIKNSGTDNSNWHIVSTNW